MAVHTTQEKQLKMSNKSGEMNSRGKGATLEEAKNACESLHLSLVVLLSSKSSVLEKKKKS